MGDLALAKLYGGVLGLPEVFLIGPDGKVIKSWRGDFKPGGTRCRHRRRARASNCAAVDSRPDPRHCPDSRPDPGPGLIFPEP